MAPTEHAISDEVLVVASILGDLKAFDSLVRRYRAAVLRIATGIAGRRLAEDITQDVLLLAFKKLPSIDEPEKFGSWLMAITRNRALRYRSQEKRRNAQRVEFDLFLLEQLPSLQEPKVLAGEDRELLEEALAGIPESYSLPLRFRFLDAMPLRYIASFLDLPVSTVKWRIFQGKKLLREAFTRIEKSESNG